MTFYDLCWNNIQVLLYNFKEKSVRTKDGIRLCLKYKKWKYYEEIGYSKYVQ